MKSSLGFVLVAPLLVVTVIALVIGVAGYGYYSDYNSIEKVCERRYGEAGEFFGAGNKLQQMSLEQAKKIAIEDCISKEKESNTQTSQNKVGATDTVGEGGSFTTGDPEKDKALELFRKEQEEWDAFGEKIKKESELCDLDSFYDNATPPKLYIPYKSYSGSLPNKYEGGYDYTINYPNGWQINTTDIEGIESVNLQKIGNEDQEITIGSGLVYSTSGAICANQYCDYDGHTFEISPNGEIVEMDVVGRSIVRRDIDEAFTKCDLSLEFRDYRIQSLFGKFEIPGYSDGVSLAITASFANETEGREIQEILNTLKF